jgi:hypothetical protein
MLADILLLNAGNYPGLPIYPYAFVQVSAIARRHGHRVRRLDLLGVERREWHGLLRAALAESNPSIVGVHLRQADSLYIWDYVEPGRSGMPASSGYGYFPVDDTRLLIETVRSVTDVPVVIGGFGFTTHARRLVELLRPDYGIQGEPDDFLANLDGILSGASVTEIENIIHRVDGRYVFGRRVFRGPPDHREYDEEVLGDLIDFYGSPGIFAPDGPHVAVEIMRGCSCHCYFCTEPMVKGRRRRTRDLDVVMEEVAFLAGRGVPRVWFVCSEINLGGNGHLLELADRMRRFNAGRAGGGVLWSTYLLPSPPLERTEIRGLLESGFRPGWNQFMSYDDANLKDTRVPYRAAHALRAQVDWATELAAHDRAAGRSGRGHRLDMFLGNSFTDARTVSTTVARLDAAGLADHHDSALITRATRVFDLGNGPIGGAGASMFSIGPEGVLSEPDLLYPTFYYPEDLTARLGGPTGVDEFFAYLEETFLSHAHRTRKDWCGFLARVTTPERFRTWCSGRHDALAGLDLRSAREETSREVGRLASAAVGDGGEQVVPELFAPRPERHALLNLVAYVLIQVTVSAHRRQVRRILDHLGLGYGADDEIEGSEYELLGVLSAQAGSETELFAGIERDLGFGPDSAAAFVIRYHLYRHNLKLRPDYRDLLFHPDAGE